MHVVDTLLHVIIVPHDLYFDLPALLIDPDHIECTVIVALRCTLTVVVGVVHGWGRDGWSSSSC